MKPEHRRHSINLGYLSLIASVADQATKAGDYQSFKEDWLDDPLMKDEVWPVLRPMLQNMIAQHRRFV